MKRFPLVIAETLASAPDVSGVPGNTFVAAADCLSKFHLAGFYSSEFAEINEQGVTEQEALSIKNDLLSLYRRSSKCDGLSTLIWALSKARDASLRSLFLDHAKFAMEKFMAAYGELSQCVVGLGDFYEPVEVPTNRSELIAEVVDKADGYLRDAGIFVPIG